MCKVHVLWKKGTSARGSRIYFKVTTIKVSLQSLEGSLGFVGVSTLNMSGLLPIIKTQLVATAPDVAALSLQLPDEPLRVDEQGG